MVSSKPSPSPWRRRLTTTLSSLLLLSTLLPLAAAQDGPQNPTINPQTDSKKLEAGLLANVKQFRGRYVDWKPQWIPEGCKSFATERGLNAADFEVRHVYYDDCSEPWIMCRHKQMEMTASEMILLISRIPVRARSLIRHFIGTPELGGGLAGLWMSSGDVVLVNKPSMRTTLHEATHALDWEVPRKAGQKESISATQQWRQAVSGDQSVPTDYSRNGFPDNFAEVGVMGFYDAYVQGGFSALQPQFGQIKNQLAVFKSSMGQNIMQGGNCTSRIKNTAAVSKATTPASARMARQIEERDGPRPETRFVDPNVGELENHDDGTVYEAPLPEPFVDLDGDGKPDVEFHDPGVEVKEGGTDGTVFQCTHDHRHI